MAIWTHKDTRCRLQRANGGWIDVEVKAIQATACGQCKKDIDNDKAESCWYCMGDLCYECWDEFGHCGHDEAEAQNEYARQMEGKFRSPQDRFNLKPIVTWHEKNFDGVETEN